MSTFELLERLVYSGRRQDFIPLSFTLIKAWMRGLVKVQGFGIFEWFVVLTPKGSSEYRLIHKKY